MGKMGAFCLDEEKMLLVARAARKHKISFLEAELMTQAPRHDRLGEAICRNWDLPQYLRQVCRYHHTFSRARRHFSEDDPMNDYIDIVILANYLTKKLFQIALIFNDPIKTILSNYLWAGKTEKITPGIVAEIEQSSILDDLLSA